MRICDPCSDLILFLFIFDQADVCLSTVQIVLQVKKSKESKRIAAYV
jgi:hypothetical protein